MWTLAAMAPAWEFGWISRRVRLTTMLIEATLPEQIWNDTTGTNCHSPCRFCTWRLTKPKPMQFWDWRRKWNFKCNNMSSSLCLHCGLLHCSENMESCVNVSERTHSSKKTGKALMNQSWCDSPEHAQSEDMSALSLMEHEQQPVTLIYTNMLQEMSQQVSNIKAITAKTTQKKTLSNNMWS